VNAIEFSPKGETITISIEQYDQEHIIKISDLPFQYCNIENNDIIPIIREKAIEGIKLIHVLSERKGVKGYIYEVPQDTHNLLKPIEQYLIGFDYNQNGDHEYFRSTLLQPERH